MSAIDSEIATLAWRQFGLLATWQALPRGITERALTSRACDERLHRVHQGVYSLVPPPLQPPARWHAAVLAYGPHAVLSHITAARLWDLLPARGSVVHVTVPDCKRRRRPGIAVHGMVLEEFEQSVKGSIPVTSVARTLLDLAGSIPPLELRRSYERAERLRLLNFREIAAVLEAHPRRRGVRRLARIAAYDPSAAAQAASELELRFLDLIRGAGLPTPQVNVLVEGYLVDFHWPEAGLVVELDGYEFHSGRREFQRDREKITALQLAGLTVLPFTHHDVTRRPQDVVGAVLGGLRRARPDSARAFAP
jgi:very-short-patch-repair endonuclease